MFTTSFTSEKTLWKMISSECFGMVQLDMHQKGVFSIKNWMGPYPNGPRLVSCDRAIRYSGFFRGPWNVGSSDRWRRPFESFMMKFLDVWFPLKMWVSLSTFFVGVVFNSPPASIFFVKKNLSETSEVWSPLGQHETAKETRQARGGRLAYINHLKGKKKHAALLSIESWLFNRHPYRVL